MSNRTRRIVTLVVLIGIVAMIAISGL